jgi:hypothetical protein
MIFYGNCSNKMKLLTELRLKLNANRYSLAKFEMIKEFWANFCFKNCQIFSTIKFMLIADFFGSAN